MGNFLTERGRQAFLEGSADWDTDAFKVVLVDLTDHAKAITGATNATPIVITATAHGFATGDVINIVGVLGNTNANGRFRITVVDANTFSLQNYDTGANIAGNAAYTSGGFGYLLSGDLNLSNIAAGARVATSANLASKTVTSGVADAADVTLTAVTGDPSEALCIYKDTGTEATSRQIAWIDTGTGLPVTPNGGDITVQWSANGPWGPPNTPGIFKL